MADTTYIDRDVFQHISSLVNRNSIDNFGPNQRAEFLDLTFKSGGRVVVTGNVYDEFQALPSRHDGLKDWFNDSVNVGLIRVGGYHNVSGKNSGEQSILLEIQKKHSTDSISMKFELLE